MLKRAITIGAALMGAGASPAAAQSVPEKVFHDIRYGVADVLSVWISPFQGDAGDWATFALAAGGAGVTSTVDDDVSRWFRKHNGSVPVKLLEPFREDRTGRLINLGAGKSLDQLGGGLWLLGLIVGSPDLRDAGMGCIASEKANGIPRHFLYKSVSRQRPMLEDGSVGDPWDIEVPGDDADWYDNSFFGGHGANIMSCASFFNHRFDLGYAEYAIYAVATGIGIGRVADQRHWASDALVGGIFGFAIGKYVAERSQKRADRRDEANAADGRSAERVGGGAADWLEGLYLGRNDGVTFVGMRRTF